MTIDEFKKCDLRVGKVVDAAPVEGSEKLLQLKVDIGEDVPRQILSGIAGSYKAEDLVGKLVVIIANLDPRAIMGMESQGMLLAASSEDGPVILSVEKNVAPGVKVT